MTSGKKVQENIEGTQINIKPSKSRNILVIKGQLAKQHFYIGEEPIPKMTEKSVQKLGHCYNVTLMNFDQVDQLRQDTINKVEEKKSLLPVRKKFQCYAFPGATQGCMTGILEFDPLCKRSRRAPKYSWR